MMAYMLANADWPKVILTIRVARRWRNADLARYLVNERGCGDNVQVLSAELGRLHRSEIAEPRVTVAIHLYDMYRDHAGEGEQ